MSTQTKKPMSEKMLAYRTKQKDNRLTKAVLNERVVATPQDDAISLAAMRANEEYLDKHPEPLDRVAGHAADEDVFAFGDVPTNSSTTLHVNYNDETQPAFVFSDKIRDA